MSHHFIRFKDVHYAYPSSSRSEKVEALQGVNFLITHGERVALLGPNGAGKSTLILLTDGLLLPSAGEVNVGDVPVSKATLPLIRQSVGIVFQNPDDQLFMPSVEEDVAFGPLNMKLPPQEVERRVVTALEAVGASELRHRSPSQLSGGQKRRVAIATVLAMEPSVLVLDEPTANLDFAGRADLLSLLDSFTHTQLIATHDLDFVRRHCPRSIVLVNGEVIADGPTPDVLSNPTVIRKLNLPEKAC